MDVDIDKAASKGHWDVKALSYILINPVSPPANAMIELRTTCGWKALVHKPLLCHYSSYYEAALYGKLKEATSDHLELELNRECADWFVRWLYSGQLKEALYAPDADELFNIYIFADRVDILALRRTVMAELVSREMSDLPYSSIILATKSLLSSAPLYRYAVEWYTNHWIPSEAERNHQDQAYEDLPKEFLHLVMSGLALRSHHLYMDKRFGKSNTEMLCKCCGPFCHYHEHDSYDEWWQTCCLLGDVSHKEVPEELKPKKPDQAST